MPHPTAPQPDPQMHAPDPKLRRAFLGSSYGTAAERAWLSELPGPAPSWAVGRWGIITAWNPAGQPSDRAGNEQRQRALAAAVEQLGRRSLPGHNGEGEWTEPALIVKDIGAAELAQLGTRFGQAAVLCGSGTRAALLWLGGGRVIRAERLWLTIRLPEPA
ncbi:MAG: DUF3293 domain-containing protein [Deinococcus sp.]|nr:DUF3293 domain-containing protein [Deinococcus sp.]